MFGQRFQMRRVVFAAVFCAAGSALILFLTCVAAPLSPTEERLTLFKKGMTTEEVADILQVTINFPPLIGLGSGVNSRYIELGLEDGSVEFSEDSLKGIESIHFTPKSAFLARIRGWFSWL